MEQEPATTDPDYWDAVIVGTGMGGATLGYALARKGLRVLFLEKGLSAIRSMAERADEPEDEAGLLEHGKWPGRMTTIVDGRSSRTPITMGCAVGGSTQLYAAALERFERWDFETTSTMPHPCGGWPIGYDEMAAYYDEAEALYRVRGSRDPLGEKRSPELPRLPPASPSDGQLMRDFARAGLSPYRLHVGIDYQPDCRECLGRPCERACKSDAGRICVTPALQTMGASLRTDCDVVRLEADGARVTGVLYRQGGTLHRVRGRVVILSAGGYRSPLLLLRSRSAAYPDGLANSSGLVGRNLMFHCADWIAVWPSRKAALTGPRKSIATRYFLAHQGRRGGMLHSVGISAGYGNILMFLYERFDSSALRRFRPLRALLRIPARIAARLFGSATVLSINVEDLPHPENRILIDPDQPDGAIVHYQIDDELRQRIHATRRTIAASLSGLRHFWLTRDIRPNWGHPCGTCRFGENPATSVLDRECRAHDLDNLYVVDASFMPTSAGVNPSLTIAANALRVADAIAARAQADGRVAAE